MGRKKALLVVAGGRGVPDVLPLLYLQPKLVLSITSKEGWDGEKPYFDIATGLPDVEVKTLQKVDAYNLDKCMKACRKLCKPYSDAEWEWTFTITSAPKVLAIAAYEVAKEMGIPCWHIDSQGERVVSLVKKKRVNKQRFFHLSFDEYVGIQERECKERNGPTPDYRQTAQNWADIAQEIALSKDAYRLTPIFYRHKKSGELDQVITFPIPLSPDIETSPLVRFLVDHGLLISSNRMYYFASKNAAQFLGTGDWLEVYAWHQTNRIKFADDNLWGYSIIKDQVYLELDLAVMYKAQLVIAECKANEKPFRGQNNYLRDIDAVADLLGRTYVSKVFITNQPGEGESYKIFSQQAEERNIVVITGERLHEVGQILEKQAKHPKYPRK
jgi:hypothetical protein